ncbi:MAG: formate dehydrogenase subunit delta, partial [Pleurocapsa sp. SU_196_0]|nr:formate dehydrogenase subunit delta [Pleurocapsa sp. SU_196_0]
MTTTKPSSASATHIRSFWEPRFRQQLLDYAESGGAGLHDVIQGVRGLHAHEVILVVAHALAEQFHRRLGIAEHAQADQRVDLDPRIGVIE